MAVQALTEWFIPEHVRQSQEDLIRARTVVGVGLMAGGIVPLFALEYFQLNHPLMAYGILVGGLGLLLGPLLMKLTGIVWLTAEYVVACMFSLVCWMVTVNGGILSTSSVWFAAVPFSAIFVAGRRPGIVWTVLTILAIGFFFLASSDPGFLPPTPLAPGVIPLVQTKSLIGVSLVVLILALSYDKAKTKGFAKLESARLDAERTSKATEEMMTLATRSIRSASTESKSIAESTELMAKTMAEQSCRAEKMTSAAQHMAVMTEENAVQSVQATKVAKEAGTAAEQGGEAMDAAMRELNTAGDVIARAAQQLEELGARSAEVNGIVQLIREIADQTNLLALNAAIEAARAGEMGRGFAVVADEVRKLAERTQGATVDIESKIKLIVNDTHQAIEAMRESNKQMRAGRDNADSAHQQLAGIIQHTRRLTDVLSTLSQAEASQSQGFAEFARNITAVDQAARALTGETHTIADATGRLDRLLAELGESVKRFDSAINEGDGPSASASKGAESGFTLAPAQVVV
jgi:methyl-accepting chemotaxis protein